MSTARQPRPSTSASMPCPWASFAANCLPASCPQQACATQQRTGTQGANPRLVENHVCPPEIEDRQFPGHREGLIKGEANTSTVGTLVERNSRLVMMVRLPESKPASEANVLQAFTYKILGIDEPLRLSMTHNPRSQDVDAY